MAMLESGEMYLETIHVLSQQMACVRSIDIVNHMGYSKPSVSRAMGILKNDGYILIAPDGGITLTDSGKAVAMKIYERHLVLTNLLMSLGVDEQTATDDACRIEHYLSDKTFDAIKAHYKKHRE